MTIAELQHSLRVSAPLRLVFAERAHPSAQARCSGRLLRAALRIIICRRCTLLALAACLQLCTREALAL